MKAPLLAWIDVETTGLFPEKGLLLEVGIAFTNTDLEVECSTNVVIPHGVNELDRSLSDPAREMHEKNGLLDDVLSRPPDTLPDALRRSERELIDFVLSRPSDQDTHQLLPIAGSNPEFDRKWLAVHMPRLLRLFHYRNFDMNTLYYFFGSKKPQVESPHRALQDILRDIGALVDFYYEQA